MTRSVLVAYPTKRGSTREVAEAVAERLGDKNSKSSSSRPSGTGRRCGRWRRCRQRSPSATEPVAVAIFDGLVDPVKLDFPFSRMPATDARDWDAIRALADEVAPQLGALEPANWTSSQGLIRNRFSLRRRRRKSIQ
jgi:hypothetical protein